MEENKNYHLKHLHKINGHISLPPECLFEKTGLWSFVIEKKGKNPRQIKFITFNEQVIATLRELVVGSRVKVRFSCKSTCKVSDDGREWWSTNLFAQVVEKWQVNEDAVKRKEAALKQYKENQTNMELFQ